MYPNQEGSFSFHDQLETERCYFIRNTKKKIVDAIPNLYEATALTSITLSKRALAKTERF